MGGWGLGKVLLRWGELEGEIYIYMSCMKGDGGGALVVLFKLPRICGADGISERASARLVGPLMIKMGWRWRWRM